ncbi:hypothetical protein [Burkholderia oklahomensis]|uniref:hypothetical protein n=1 Tax=Burkholderia oklahomensis TaxID=342113 RepID=UPI00190F2B2E|nr:hypothetical protein [Burkholderia oklahomensis]
MNIKASTYRRIPIGAARPAADPALGARSQSRSRKPGPMLALWTTIVRIMDALRRISFPYAMDLFSPNTT